MKKTVDIVLTSEPTAANHSMVPLTPRDAGELQRKYPVRIVVEPSSHRLFTDEEYRREGVTVGESWESSSWVIGTEAIAAHRIEPGGWYFLSSQFPFDRRGNRYGKLERFRDQGVTLFDIERLFEKTSDECPSMARFTGMAVMADTLYVLGRKWWLGGIDNPLAELKPPSAYDSPAQLLEHLDRVGERISEEGLPEQVYPLMITILGGGAYMAGIDEALSRFPLKTFSPYVVDENVETFSGDMYSLYKIVLSEEELVEPAESPFLSMSAILINTLAGSPRILTREYLKTRSYLNPNPFPRVVADLSGCEAAMVELFDHVPVSDESYCSYLGRKDSFGSGIDASGTTLLQRTSLKESYVRELSVEYSLRLTRLLMKLMDIRVQSGNQEGWAPSWLYRAMVLDQGRPVPDLNDEAG